MILCRVTSEIECDLFYTLQIVLLFRWQHIQVIYLEYLASICVCHQNNSHKSLDILVLNSIHWFVIFTWGWAYWILSMPIHPFQNAMVFVWALWIIVHVNPIVFLYLLTMVRFYLKSKLNNCKYAQYKFSFDPAWISLFQYNSVKLRVEQRAQILDLSSHPPLAFSCFIGGGGGETISNLSSASGPAGVS